MKRFLLMAVCLYLLGSASAGAVDGFSNAQSFRLAQATCNNQPPPAFNCGSRINTRCTTLWCVPTVQGQASCPISGMMFGAPATPCVTIGQACTCRVAGGGSVPGTIQKVSGEVIPKKP